MVAADLVTSGLPCLRLFGQQKAADGSDVYEIFADIFTVLMVRERPPMEAVHSRIGVVEGSRCRLILRRGQVQGQALCVGTCRPIGLNHQVCELLTVLCWHTVCVKSPPHLTSLKPHLSAMHHSARRSLGTQWRCSR